MPRICSVTGKSTISGNSVSHSNNKVKRKFLTNIKKHRFWDDDRKSYVTLKVSTKGIRIIDKKGLKEFLKNK